MQAVRQSISYAGDVTPLQAWESLRNDPAAQLVDVRTPPEWNAGIPNLSSLKRKPHLIGWKLLPAMEINSQFIRQVQAIAPDPATPLYFLCRSGGRSASAAEAMTQAGYHNCYNIAGGFEGRSDDDSRGTITGWKTSNLAWEQA